MQVYTCGPVMMVGDVRTLQLTHCCFVKSKYVNDLIYIY